MPTGRASRASVLTNACLRASGASPRHSAIFCARSSKRTVRLISGVALDECLDPEHYRARGPIFEPLNAKKLERPAARNEPGIDYTPQCPGILTWWSHVWFKGAGVSWWKRPTRGSKSFNQRQEWVCFLWNIGRYGRSLRILQPGGAHTRAPRSAALQRGGGHRSDLPFLRGFHPQDLDA
jgi:hypothetical protein